MKSSLDLAHRSWQICVQERDSSSHRSDLEKVDVRPREPFIVGQFAFYARHSWLVQKVAEIDDLGLHSLPLFIQAFELVGQLSPSVGLCHLFIINLLLLTK